MSFGDLGEGAPAVSAQREEWDEHDPLVGAVVDDVFVAPFGEVVPVLDRGDRDEGACLFDLVDVHLREADVPDLPAVAVFLDHGEALLERGLGVDSVQVVERDGFGA